MAFDAHKNLAVSAVVTAPTPATSGTSLTVTAGEGARFPAPPFNATVWPVNAMPTPLNGEVIRVTGRTTDTLTITRAQEGSTARAIGTGDLIAATITAKTLTDLETRSALKDEKNTFTHAQQLELAGPALYLVDTSAPADARTFDIVSYGQFLMVRVLNDAQNLVQAEAMRFNRAGDVMVGRYLHERGRATPLGTRQTWAAVGTTAEGAAIGGSITASFAVVGQILYWSLFALSVNLPAPTAHLRFTAPPGYSPSSPNYEQPSVRINMISPPGNEWGWAEADASYIKMNRASGSWPVGAAHVIGQGFYFTNSI